MATVTPSLNLEESQLKSNILKILEARYLLKDANGELLENPHQMFKRVAKAIAQAEETQVAKDFWESEFYDLMTNNWFLPNSPTLMNAGVDGTLSACFVIGIDDSMESILYAQEKAGMVMKFGGGVGYYLGNIRAKNTPIKSTHGKACGPIAVLEQLNQLSKMITQGGKRSGANMAILPMSHPDIEEFIHCKDGNLNAGEKNQVIDQFNISISTPNSFFDLLNLPDGEDNWDLINPSNKQIVRTVSAKKLWKDITHSAWATGDPGIFFVDTVNEFNTTPNLGRLEATNPCGEVPLYPEEACNLGSIILPEFAYQNGGDGLEINWDRLEEAVKTSTRFLDNVVTINKFPVQEIRDTVDKTRKLGLGVIGWQHLLIKMGIPYDSIEAVDLAERIMSFIYDVAHETSEKLAGERGSFPAHEGSIFIKPRRNATVTCIAPTGTISRIAGSTFGIEPSYAWITESKILRGQIKDSIIDVDPAFENLLIKYEDKAEKIKDWVINNEGSLQNCPLVSEADKKLYKTANEISGEWHIRHQAAFQKGTDLAVSKTINLPYKSTVEDIDNAYKLARELKCKGITIYRDGSRQFQILNTVKADVEKKLEDENIEIKVDTSLDLPQAIQEPRKLDWKAQTVRYKVPTPLGVDCLIFVSKDEEDNPREVVIVTGKAGSDILADAEALGRSITLGLKFGVPIENYHSQLAGIQSGKFIRFNGDDISSLSDAVAYALRDYINNPDLELVASGNYDYCPRCSNTLIYTEGCMSCSNLQCDFSKC